MKRSSGLLALALGISLASPAVCARGGWWETADVNADGKLSIVEAAANPFMKCRFLRVDLNKDGFVTSDEYRLSHTRNASKDAADATAHSSAVNKDLVEYRAYPNTGR